MKTNAKQENNIPLLVPTVTVQLLINQFIDRSCFWKNEPQNQSPHMFFFGEINKQNSNCSMQYINTLRKIKILTAVAHKTEVI